MITRRVLVGVAIVAAMIAAATAQAPQGGRGRGRGEPEIAPPTIREYKPKSTLVVPQHPVPRAKFPTVDMHGHPPPLTSAETIASVVTAMDSLNLRVMVVTGNPGRIPRDQMKQDLAMLASSPH